MPFAKPGPARTSAAVLKARGSRLWKQREREEREDAARKARFFPQGDNNSSNVEEAGSEMSDIESPAWVSARGKFWKSIGQQLIDEDKLDPDLDMTAFSMMARCLSDYEAALKIIDAEGYTCKSESGGLYQHPCVGIANKAREAYLRIAREFGLVGPASRENI